MKSNVWRQAVLIILIFLSNFIDGAIPPEERAVLIALYNSTNGDNWRDNSGWKEPPLDTDGFAMPGTEGNWYGITAASDHVTEIDLLSNQLTGNISSELENLSNLLTLNLGGNELSGTIPTELTNLNKLKFLSLAFNNLTGTIPAKLFELNSLESLHLGGNNFSNMKLKDFSELRNLKFLNLKGSNISGSIPQEFFNLTKLESLWLSGNRLSGSIPAEIATLSNLIFLDLSTNLFSGSIPEELFNLIHLKGLWIGWNGLSGSMSENIGSLTQLVELDLNSNNITGGIPTALGNLSSLEYLNLSHNRLSGALPKSLTNLTNLSSPNVDIGFNCLDTNDPGLITWLNSVDPDWEGHQDECGFALTVQSSPNTGVPITVIPNDIYDQGNGTTEFFRTYNFDTDVKLTAPESYKGKDFVKWLIDGIEDSNRTVQVTMDNNHTAHAVYQSPTYNLTIQSSPAPGVSITVSPIDNTGNGNGNTNFIRTYNSGQKVSLTAPSSFNDSDFIEWTVDGNNYAETSIQVTMDSNHSAVVYYAPPPMISVNRNCLNFSYIIGSNNQPTEFFTISNSGGGTLNWQVSTEVHCISLSPASGTNSGKIKVSIDPVSFNSGEFDGVIYVSDHLASNSPMEVEIKLWVKEQSESFPPFGDFSTPTDNSTVYGSIPVTGWALGDTGVDSVKIYREEGSSLVYIGDAVFVEGARPDIEATYPDYPMNYKAGWGYMMLTNFLPNRGNGEFKIRAIATDKDGQETTLGVKTIFVDNANAVKPFGSIDTPDQGVTALGSRYINWGWVLTPLPNYIPTDGSTIKVIVDGVNLGHPTYNIYRADIANLFPEYSNSIGAIGYYILDTTAYENGVHTIQWTATDSGGNTDGIGSRYFMIENTGGSAESTAAVFNVQRSMLNGERSRIPIDYWTPVRIKKGNRSINPREMYPDEEGIINIEIKESERLEIHFFDIDIDRATRISSWKSMLNLSSLPTGSTLDSARGVFYWLPGPGFIGDYEFEFIKAEGNNREKVRIKIKVLPKFSK